MIIIAFFLVLGFMYSWVLSAVSRDDIPIWKGAVILFGSALAFGAVTAGLSDQSPLVGVAVTVPVNFLTLVVLTKVIAQIEWKHAAISAGIYTALLFLIGLGLSMCAG